jgi:ribosomal protein L37AE/L43A
MDKVVEIAEYRRKRQPAAERPQTAMPAAGSHYVCLRCETNEFRLYSTGAVHCAHCGALMRNLLIGAPPK